MPSVAKAADLAQMLLRSSGVPADIVSPLKDLGTTGVNAGEISAELERSMARIAVLESTTKIAFRRNEKLMDEVKQRHTEKTGIWKEIFQENL